MDNEKKNMMPAGLKERLDYNKDFQLDWHDPDEAHDGYQLKWVGKNYARLEAGTAPETMIFPDAKHNKKTENINSGNLFFSGDNLQMLKHLRNCYSNAVKMIYIDPPYNTGSDGFVYKDKFEFSDEQLQSMLGLTEKEVKRLHIINGRSSHSAWLTFMYPRLKIARDLLRDDGVIFISIDDNEQANLKLLCDEIFGEANFVSNIIWEKRYGRNNDAKLAASVFDYLLLYRKSDSLKILREIRTEENNKAYDNPDNDPRGAWTSISFVSQRTKAQRPNLAYNIVNPNTGEEISHETNSWKYDEEKYKELQADGRLYWGKDGTQKYPRIKRFLAELSEGIVPVNLWKYKDAGTGDEGTREVSELIGKNVFPYPKPVRLVKRAMSMIGKDGIIMDFFAGSGTTAQAVMELNKQDSGNRQYILCQLDEPVKEKSEASKVGYQTIDEIACERIKRAAAKIGDKSGFRHYYIKPAQAATIDRIEEFDPSVRRMLPDNMVAEFACADLETSGEEVILATWLAADGYKFTDKTGILDFCGYKAHYAGNSRLYLISEGWGTEQTKELLNRVGTYQINLNALIIYGYSFSFESLKELQDNVRQSLDKDVLIIKRY